MNDVENKNGIEGETLIPTTVRDYDHIFDIYAVWRALPTVTLNKMSRRDMLESMGVDDELILELATIKTQSQFAERYNVHINTLTDWNKRILELDPLREVKKWAQILTKNMVTAMYTHAIKKGDAQLYKLFFQVVNDWSEKQKVEHDYLGVTEVNISLAAPKQHGTETKTEDNNKLGGDIKTAPSVGVPTRQEN